MSAEHDHLQDEVEAPLVTVPLPVVTRPEVKFTGESHEYFMGDEKVLGVSTVAKVGGAFEAFGIASAWGFRVGYEGAWDALLGDGKVERGVGATVHLPSTKDKLRAILKAKGLTPWSKRDAAAARGTAVHDLLEKLAQGNEVGDLTFVSDEERGHARAVYAWYVDYRPEFVATEVQVASEEHRFSGRYDIRCLIEGCRLHSVWPAIHSCQDQMLCLVDLKTSKGVYPTTHFPQLSGYELASVEMGFPATDAQFVLNTKPDGTYNFVRSTTGPEHFLAFLAAARAIRDIEKKGEE